MHFRMQQANTEAYTIAYCISCTRVMLQRVEIRRPIDVPTATRRPNNPHACDYLFKTIVSTMACVLVSARCSMAHSGERLVAPPDSEFRS